jgi:hypothetical protein
MKLRVDPIPVCLFGFNLRKFVPQKRWLKLRKELIAERGQKCETCGKTVEDSPKLHAHEVWEFSEEPKPLVTLKRIALSCWHCHMCEHWGQLGALVASGRVHPGAMEDVMAHFCAVNGVAHEAFEPHKDEAFATMRKRTKILWDIDWGEYAPLILEYHDRLPQPGQYSPQELGALSAGCAVPIKTR